MSEHVLAIVWIGGQLHENRADVLTGAINKSPVFAYEGDTYFEPCNANDLVDTLTPEGTLYLCDDTAPWGDMPEIKKACRELGLPYRHWHESLMDFGSLVEMWAPGMKQPVAVSGDHTDATSFFVNGPDVRRALALLEEGKDDEAAVVLNTLVPEMPPLPRFELIGVERTIGFAADETRATG